jgi:hypothetical protein
MIVTAVNNNTAVLQNIISTLSQIKVSGQANAAIQIDNQTAGTDPALGLVTLSLDELVNLSVTELAGLPVTGSDVYTINIYSDQARSNLIVTDNSTANPNHFVVDLTGRVFYVPSDTGLNDAATISTTASQPLYYLTVTSTAGLYAELAYNNADNLLFQSVIVSTTDKPTFTQNTNQIVIVPKGERQINMEVSGIHGHVIASFDVYVQQICFNWQNLSEQSRIQKQQQAANLIRNVLYLDRYRGATCTMLGAQLNGTLCKEFKPLASDAVLKGVMRVDCAYWCDNDSTF